MSRRLLDWLFAGSLARQGAVMQKSIHLALGCTFLLIGCAGDGVDVDGVTDAAPTAYAAYQSATDGRVQFVVTSLERGDLISIAARPVNDLVGIPDHWVRMQQRCRRKYRRTMSVWSSTPDGRREWQLPFV